MVEIRLHGALAADFGKVWNLDVRTVQEAVQAIDANMEGFRRRIMQLARKGMVFRVRAKNHDYDNDDVHLELGDAERVDIIPLVMGASAGVRFVIGAVLVVAGFVMTAYGIPGGNFLISAGVSMMLGSVVEWLTPKVSKENGDKGSLQSWTISGPTNTVDQGLPVPVIYGEVLTGGYAISGGISVSQLVNGTTGPSVTITGVSTLSDRAGSGGSYVSEFNLGASVANMVGPFVYEWTYTGFAGATVELLNAGKAAVTVRVTYPVTVDDQMLTVTGDVIITVDGFASDGAGGEVSATATRACSLNLNSSVFYGGGPADSVGGVDGDAGDAPDSGSGNDGGDGGAAGADGA